MSGPLPGEPSSGAEGGAALERGVGVAAIAGYALTPLLDGDPYDLLWACHFGLFLSGLALLCRSVSGSGAAFLWVAYGTSLWFLDALNGRELGPLTLAVHLGGLGVASWAVWRRGWPERWVGWRAVAGILALQQLCRWITPPALNVNLAFGIRAGWEGAFSDYLAYTALLCAGGSALILTLELACRRWLPRAGEARRPGALVAGAGGEA